MKLVFIEGPGKKETIEKYLGSEYKVFPTKGHVRDLPAKSFAIDINNNYEKSTPKHGISTTVSSPTPAIGNASSTPKSPSSSTPTPTTPTSSTLVAMKQYPI